MADPPRVDDRVLDGAEPTEEVGLAESEAGIASTEQRAGVVAAGEPPQDSEFSGRSEIDDAFPTESIPLVLDPVDGLPVPADDTTRLALAAPFTFDTVVCIEDDRQWVEVWKEELPAYETRYGVLPDGLRRLIVGMRAQYTEDGQKMYLRLKLEAAATELRWGHHVAPRDDKVTYTLLRPIRERCVHYKRQVAANDDQPNPNEAGHLILFRNCGARRSVGGALMSLRDEAIYACDYRVPADFASSERYLDGPDRERLRSNAHLKHLPLFNLGGEEHDRTPAKNGSRVRVINERDPHAEG
jgi:hypothetical protein